MTISSSSLKLNKFKNLVAYTTSATCAFFPSLVFAGLLTLYPNPLVAAIGLVAQIMYPLIFFIERDPVFVQPMNPRTWKNIFNLLPQKLQTRENEKIILMLREWRSNQAPSEQQLKILANFVADTQLHAVEAHNWNKKISEDQDYNFGDKFKTNTRQKETQQAVQEFLNKTPQFNDYVKEIIQEKITSSNIELKIKELAKEIGANKKFYWERESVVKNFNEFLFAQNAYSQLKPNDYKNFEQLVKKENEMTIDVLIGILEKHPEKVNWLKMSQLLDKNYKSHSDWYHNLQAKFEKLGGVAKKHETQATLQSNAVSILESIQKNRVSHPESIANAIESPNPAGIKRCDYVDYQPSFYPEKWSEIKKDYDTIMANIQRFDEQTVRDLHYVMNTCMPSLVITDGNLAAVPQAQSRQAKQLMLDNLNLISIQIKDTLENLNHKNIKEMEVLKTYQHMKMGKN